MNTSQKNPPINYPRLWFYLDATLGKAIRASQGDPIHFHTVNSLSMVKRLMWRMEAAVGDEKYSEEKFKNLWIFLDFILGNTLRTLKGKPDHFHIIFPMALVKWLMERMEEAEDQGDFDEVYENLRNEISEQQK